MTEPLDSAARLGIQRHYLDNAEEPAELSPETIEALRVAIGDPDPDLDAFGPLVLRPDYGWRPAEAGRLELEDGTELDVTPAAVPDVPLGYHWLHTATGRRRLIMSPGRCVPPAGRGWGWTAQLYATRSHRSWGIGDLADLRRLTELAADQGASFVLVNPLHAGGSTSTELPQQPSPYFPSSRRFFSPLYLSVADLPGAAEVLGPERLAATEADRDRHIDRDRVWQRKRAALREVFDRTGARSSTELQAWRQRQGRGIEDFAAWNVLSERFGTGWPEWPEPARRPDGELARRVHQEQPDDVAFVVWLQWQADRQLRAAGRPLAVLQDLPIGVDPQGADAWSYQDLLAPGVTVGAPPDPFNRAGQDWGLPPFVPWRLRAQNYEPFIESIRATIGLAGGLRIDHVMGLFRLWWVPSGAGAEHGGYVRYPASELLDIVALESHRAQAPVVGEDLGTVEAGVREELSERNVLSYRLLWFEPDPPSQWPTQALAAVSTHDLPTVAGLWDGSDLLDQQASGLDADAEATEQLRERLQAQAGLADDATAEEAVLGAYRLLSQAPSVLLAASLEDALVEPVRPNIPGSTERANWSTALPTMLDELPAAPGVSRLVHVLNQATRPR